METIYKVKGSDGSIHGEIELSIYKAYSNRIALNLYKAVIYVDETKAKEIANEILKLVDSEESK